MKRKRWGKAGGRERTDARARRDAGRSDSPRPARVAMIVHMCISRGADGEMSMGLLPGGGSLGGCGPSAAGDDSLPGRFVGCVLSSVLSSMAELSARAPPDVPPPEGVADMPVVRELIVRTLASLAVTDSKRFLDVTAPDFDPYRGSLKALGRLACVSRGYRDDTRDPYIVDALLGGLAEPGWREWARGWRGKTRAAFVFAPRVDLGDVHRLLRAEHVAKHVIDASNSEHHASRRARGEDTTARDEWRPSTLRASIAFPPARHSLPERDDAALEAHRARRDELERELAPHACTGESLDRRARRLVDALEANSNSLREEYESRADKASAGGPVRRRLLRERKKLKRGLKRVQKARDKHDSDLDVVKAREEYIAALTDVWRLERLARCKGPQLACRDPNPDERAVFPPTQVGGVPDWPWHNEEGVCGERKGFPEVDAWEFVAQVNFRQVHASSSLIPEGLLPERGILYFFLDRDFDTMDEDGQECLVRFYPDLSDSPPWPGANPDGSAEAAHQRTNLRSFQKMGHTRFNPVMYRSAAIAPARDVLTMRPHIDGFELLPPEWAEWQELDFPQDHPLSELFDDECDDMNAEFEYAQSIRDAFPCPPVDVPVMLGYPIVSEEAFEFWTEFEPVGETTVGLVSQKDSLLLLQIAPHGPHGSWIAFLATEETLRNREWTRIHHHIYPANFEG